MTRQATKPVDQKCNVLRFTGFREHTKRDGSTVTLTLFERLCRNCHQPFEVGFSVGGQIAFDATKASTVRCPDCRPQRNLKPEGEQP